MKLKLRKLEVFRVLVSLANDEYLLRVNYFPLYNLVGFSDYEIDVFLQVHISPDSHCTLIIKL